MILHIGPQLAGKAQQAYAAMDVSQAGEYVEVKMILRKYGVNQESYSQKYHTARKGQGETHQDLALRIEDLNRKWTRDCQSVEEIRDLMNTEQLLEVLPSYLSTWVRERKPTMGVEAGELADEYVEARKSSYGARGSTGTGREVRSNPGENTYRRYAWSNLESSERTRRPNGEVRGSKLNRGRLQEVAENGSVSHVVRWDISKENVRKTINLGVMKALNKEARYHRR